jgi:hypothetical protein
VTGGFCDVTVDAGSGCCQLANKGTIAVDAILGIDDPCCGTGTNKPCLTLSRAMAMISGAQATNVTVNATVDLDGGDWTSAEVYPVVLGWGVELSAPGVFFLDTDGGNSMMFDVKAAAGDPLGYASVIGTAASPVAVGINSAQSVATPDYSAIAIETGATLYLANAMVDDADNGAMINSTILVNFGATLWLGEDQSTANTGTVYVGNNLGQAQTNGYIGINCLSDGLSQGGTVNDNANLVGQSGVVIQGQGVALWLNDYSTASLTAAPKFGAADCLTGTFTEIAGAVVDGHAQLTFSNGVVQCMGFVGLGTSSTTPGNPTITVDKSLIEQTVQGLSGNAGTITVTNSTLTGNYYGAYQVAGTIDLSGGGNTVVCSSGKLWSESFGPGVDVINISTTNLPADNVTWDTEGPDYFTCDSPLQVCTCNIATCTVAPGSDGMDAVEDSTNLGGITLTGNSYSDAGCN